MPFTFFKKQVVAPTPPRLVKFILRASSVTQGESSTVPTSDQVPELMKAQSFPVAGTAATAEAVSWQAGTINRVPRKAESVLNGAPTVPTTHPVGTICGVAL